MKRLSAITFLVPDYDAGIAFFVDILGFKLIEDSQVFASKRWVLVAPDETSETRFLIAKADGPTQQATVGNQTGGRVGFFLETDDFEGDFSRFSEKGLCFNEEPRFETYGTVAVFSDPFGNLWDLIQFANN